MFNHFKKISAEETVHEARNIYLNVFDTIKERHWNSASDPFTPAVGFNFIILNGIFLCKEHSCPN